MIFGRVLAGLSVASLLMLSACATPAETAARNDQEVGRRAEELARAQGGYDAAVAGRDAAIRSAEEWNNHVLGIPASGWLVLVVIAGVVTFALLVLGAYGVYRSLKHRREMAANRYRALTELAAELSKRDKCPKCFYEPIPDDMLTAAKEKASG